MILPLLLLAQAKTASCCAPTMASFATDPAFLASHAAPEPLAWEPKTGKSVVFPSKDGTSAKGFYVPGTKAAIVMCHEYWGLNEYIKREAETLHEKTGYAVLAVDLYDGKIATDSETAGKYMQQADPKRDTAIVAGAVGVLTTGGLGTKYAKLGTIGWCFGGGWSLNTAISGGTTVKAAVAYYGMPPQDVTGIKAPVLFIYGTQDGWINKDVAEGFRSRMQAQSKPITVVPYDAPHAFANPSNPKYNKAASEDAWAKVIAFYKKELG